MAEVASGTCGLASIAEKASVESSGTRHAEVEVEALMLWLTNACHSASELRCKSEPSNSIVVTIRPWQDSR